MSKIFLIDGTALIYRAYFAFINNPLRNSSGENTSAIFGVVNTFLKLINNHQPDRIVISFDLKEPTFRHEITDTYKANRPPAPEELISQIEPVKDFFKLLDIPEISIAGYEADDILATLAQEFKNDYEVVVITSDKDFAQIVDDKVVLYDPFAEKYIDRDQVKEKYGVTPDQFVDFLALIGDSSDNIPGVKGVGAKGAAALLEQFDNLDEIYDNLEHIGSESLRKKLIEGKEMAHLSRRLAQIVRDVPIRNETGLDVKKLIMDTETTDEKRLSLIIPFLKKYELHSILKKLSQSEVDARPSTRKSIITAFEPHIEESEHKETPPNIDPQVAPVNELLNNEEEKAEKDVVQLSFDFYDEEKNPRFAVQIINKLQELADFIESLTRKQVVAIALEPSSRRGELNSSLNNLSSSDETDISNQSNHPMGISMCADHSQVAYIPFKPPKQSFMGLFKSDNDNMDNNSEISTEDFLIYFKRLPAITIIAGHNIKQDYLILAHYGQVLREPLFDTMIASYLLDSALYRHSLLDCAQRELHQQLATLDELLGSGKKRIDIRELDIDRVANIAAEDANVVYRLYERYQKRLADLRLDDLFFNIEMPLSIVLAKMERDGVYVDCNVLQDINVDISKEIDKLTDSIYKLTGKEFNINSTQQLGKILFDEMGIPPVKKTKTGFSTDNTVLEILAEDFEIAQLLIEYRQLTKLRSTYVESLPQLVNKQTGRIHSSFNQTVTSTGRLSSSNPNLQNIPIRSKAGKEIRKAFTVESQDYLILSADYSQIELRILGILSKDRNMITAFNHNQDIHAQTAGLILNKPITTITQDERRMAKAINFGIIYGMGANKLARETGISLIEAKEFIESYFTKFSRVKEFIQQQKYKARSYGYAETIMGRRLTIPNIHSSNQRLQSEAERIAVNMPIQGSAADIMKMAMVRLDKEFEKINRDADQPLVKMIIQVHDELVLEVHKRVLERVRELVVREMKNALPEKYRIVIPLAIDTGSGANWFEAHT